MSAINGHVETQGKTQGDLAHVSVSTAVQRFSPQEVRGLLTELEVPFDQSLIEWRVTATTKHSGPVRGQVVPYTDQRAYTDRLNALFTPAGWTRKYSVHTSPHFERSDDQKLVAKVFVTCELTIFGIGSHSATGEEWADNENAGTAAEAQSFKRAACCFGLGRYLYYFSGMWVDLDERRRVIEKPVLTDWATPEGWRKGLRPQVHGTNLRGSGQEGNCNADRNEDEQPGSKGAEQRELIREIEAMAEPLGSGLYRGILKDVAWVWNASEINELSLLEKVVAHMQAARRGLSRLEAALAQAGPEALNSTLRSFDRSSMNQIRSLKALREVVHSVEEKAMSFESEKHAS